MTLHRSSVLRPAGPRRGRWAATALTVAAAPVLVVTNLQEAESNAEAVVVEGSLAADPVAGADDYTVSIAAPDEFGRNVVRIVHYSDGEGGLQFVATAQPGTDPSTATADAALAAALNPSPTTTSPSRGPVEPGLGPNADTLDPPASAPSTSTTAAPTTAAPTTAAPTTAAPNTTAAPATTAPPTTAAPVTTPPATTAAPTTAPPTTAPPATTVPPTTAPPVTTPPTTTPPTTAPAPTTTAPQQTIWGQPYDPEWPSLDMWERLSLCESSGDWAINTGNGYYGGIQFGITSWEWVGGSGLPSEASREEQIYRGNLLWELQGWNGWPGCKRYFGWSRWQISQ